MICKIVSPFIVGSFFITNINQFPCLIQFVTHIGGLPMIWKWSREHPIGNQHLWNFDAAHDSTKAQKNHLHQPQRSYGCYSCNPMQEVASFSTQPPLPIPYIHGQDKDMEKWFILVSSNIKYLSHIIQRPYHTSTNVRYF